MLSRAPQLLNYCSAFRHIMLNLHFSYHMLHVAAGNSCACCRLSAHMSHVICGHAQPCFAFDSDSSLQAKWLQRAAFSINSGQVGIHAMVPCMHQACHSDPASIIILQGLLLVVVHNECPQLRIQAAGLTSLFQRWCRTDHALAPTRRST